MGRYFCIICFVLPILAVPEVAAQEDQIDSLEVLLTDLPEHKKTDVLNELSRAYWGISLEESERYAVEALDLARIYGDQKGIADAFNRIGNVKHLSGEIEESLEYYTRSLEIREEIGDFEGILASHNNLSIVYSLLGMRDMQLDHLKEAYKKSREEGASMDAAEYANRVGNVKSSMYDFDNAHEYFNIAYDIYSSLGERGRLASVYNGLGTMYSNMALYDLALENYLNSLVIYNEEGDELNQAALLINIGNIHQNLDNIDLALECYMNSLQIYERSGNGQLGLSTVYNNIGIIHFMQEDYEQSLQYFNKALEINEEEDNETGIAAQTNNIGLVNTRLGNYDSALESFLKSVEINRARDRRYQLANNFNNIGELFILTGEYDKAAEYLDDGLVIATELNAREIIKENYEFRADLHALRNEFAEALKYRKLFDEYRENIYTRESRDVIGELQIRHESENRIKELEILQNDYELQELRLERQRTMQLFLAGLTLLLILMIFLVYRLYLYKKRSIKLLEQKNRELKKINHELSETEQILKKLGATKDRFFSIIAHDLRNPFNALLGFTEMLSQNIDEFSKEEIKTYVDIIHKSAQNLYQLLENLLQWSRSQTGSIDFDPGWFSLKEVSDEVVQALQIHSERKNIKVKNNIKESHSVFADENLFSTVIRNLLSNSIKFTATGGRVELSSKEDRGFIEVSVKDNGTGIEKGEIKKLFSLDYNVSKKGTQDEKGTGLGLALSKEFVEKNGGRIWAESTPGMGSIFKFTVPK